MKTTITQIKLEDHSDDGGEVIYRKVNSAPIASRFMNFAVDYAFIAFIVMAVYFLMAVLFDQNQSNSTTFIALTSFISLGIYFLYYIILEYSRQQTLGKMVTNTYVINEYAEPISIFQAFMRTLCRWIPFEFITFLLPQNGSHGLHDSIPKTWVVKKEELTKLQSLLSEEEA